MNTHSLPESATPHPLADLAFAWLEVTGFCNLECHHCYADSSPQGTHGTMSTGDWITCIDQLAAMGTQDVRFIGGEPLLHRHLKELVVHAGQAELRVEVFSNLTFVSEELWQVFTEYGVTLATSHYSDAPSEHDAVTARRGSHARTRSNIQRARELGLPLRDGVISVLPGAARRGGSPGPKGPRASKSSRQTGCARSGEPAAGQRRRWPLFAGTAPTGRWRSAPTVTSGPASWAGSSAWAT